MFIGVGVGLVGCKPLLPSFSNLVAPVISIVSGNASSFTATCSTGTWSPSEGTTYSYQFLVDGIEEQVGISDDYIGSAVDFDKDITCVVSATNDGVTLTQATSNVLVVRSDIPVQGRQGAFLIPKTTDVNGSSDFPLGEFGDPSVSVGDTIKCTEGSYVLYDELGVNYTPITIGGGNTLTYQWIRDFSIEIPGATTNTYIVQNEDLGTSLYCFVKVTVPAISAEPISWGSNPAVFVE